jgi:hypothetical protein
MRFALSKSLSRFGSMMPSTVKNAEDSPMAHEIAGGTMLVKDNVLPPKKLRLEVEPCLPGWRSSACHNGLD